MPIYELAIANNTDSDLIVGMLDASKPDSPLSIVSTGGYDYVDVPYAATYAIGDSFSAVIGGTTYSSTLTSVCTPTQVCALLTNLGQGYWTSETIGSNTRFTFVATLQGTLLTTLTYTPGTPTVVSFTATSAGYSDTVTITGTNFTGATAVTFGGTNATSFTVVNSTTITAVVASGTTGSVAVTTSAGTGTLAGFTFLNGWRAMATTAVTNINVVSATTIFAIQSGEVVKSTDSGVTFTPITSFGYALCGGLSMMSATQGLALFYSGIGSAYVCATTNGTSFSLIQTIDVSAGGIGGGSPNNSIQLLDASNGFIALGMPSMFETSLYYSATPLVGGFSLVGASMVEIASNIINISFASSSTGLIAFPDKIYKTSNSGTSWTAVLSSTLAITDIQMVTALVGYCVDSTSTVLYTTGDGGSTWTQVCVFGDRTPISVSFTSALVGQIASVLTATSKLIVCRTADGGASTTDDTQDDANTPITAGLRMFNATTGYVATTNKFLKTTTGGL